MEFICINSHKHYKNAFVVELNKLQSCTVEVRRKNYNMVIAVAGTCIISISLLLYFGFKKSSFKMVK